MSILESIRTSLEAIGGNKMRSALTMLGIIIGVAAVVALSGLGAGVKAMITDTIQDLGSNLLQVTASQPENATGPVYLTMGDAEALSDPFNASALARVAPQMGGPLHVTYGEQNTNVSVTGTTSEAATITNLELSLGGFLTAADVEEGGRVAVLGWTTYTDLFAEGEYPIDKSIYIDGSRFRVVGVLKEKGGMVGGDDRVYVPISTAQARLFTERTLSGDYPLSAILAAVADKDLTDAAVTQIEETLRQRHDIAPSDEDDFRVFSQQEILDTSKQITTTISAFLGIVAGISLLVGGIGIMNIMLVTVTERTREIGIRKAVGASSGAVLVQFLIESMILTLLGGALGIAFGIGVSKLMASVLEVAPQVTVGILALAAGISSAVGLIFGVYPAMRAARLRPIEALRYE